MFKRFFHREGKFVIKVKQDEHWWYVLRTGGVPSVVASKENATVFDTMADSHTFIAEQTQWFKYSTEDYQVEDV